MAGDKRFFVDDEGGTPAVAAPYNEPRPMTAGSAVLNLKTKKTSPIRKPHAWQTAAWDFTDQIGELKYAFGLISQLASRASIFSALNFDDTQAPKAGKVFLERFNGPQEDASVTAAAVKIADEIMGDLTNKSEIMRLLAENISIAGECYLHNVDGWGIASISEFTPGTPPKFNKHKDATRAITAPKGAYVARLWRSHPRWSGEADSTMLGVLDQCEKLILFDQVVRSVSRSKLGAGAVFIPSGLVPASGKSVVEAFAEITVQPVEDETALGNVVPVILEGPIEVGKEVKRLALDRPIDPEMTRQAEIAMNRMLDGIDIPKNVVSGFEGSRYAVAVVVDDSLYKAHIEPLIMIICDLLTSAYLRPLLRKRGVAENLIKKFVVWYDPAAIVTRPDKSQSANEGYDRYLLSEEAWRTARGYNREDAPSDAELLRRLAMEKAVIPPDLATTLIENIDPEFFKKQKQAGADTAGIPSDIQNLLSGTPSTPDTTGLPPGPKPAPGNAPGVSETPAQTATQSGGPVGDNGTQPPSPVKR